jgi:hypothetical protein
VKHSVSERVINNLQQSRVPLFTTPFSSFINTFSQNETPTTWFPAPSTSDTPTSPSPSSEVYIDACSRPISEM